MNDFKIIHIGNLIEKRYKELNISGDRACNFFKTDEKTILIFFEHESIDLKELLKWSKLLEYDFFRLYSQHILLYAPISAAGIVSQNANDSSLPHFRKNIYTQEMINFILNLVKTGEKQNSR